MQDSEEDWRHESGLMAAVYSNAWCNIAADGASNGNSGLFFDRSYMDFAPPVIDRSILMERAATKRDRLRTRVRSVFSKKHHESKVQLAQHKQRFCGFLPPRVGIIVDKEYWTLAIRKSGLAQRAWVLQEELLAKRVVHFTSTQVFFECRKFQACEAFSQGLTQRGGYLFPAGPDVRGKV